MRTVRIVRWQEEDGIWLGYLDIYPDLMTQGTSLEELQQNLRDILKEVEGGNVPLVRTHEDMAV
ncbi:MAG: type II toxin-antitoxin system HicB family antitoxin [Syntrophobacteraceae bacterium]